ncbi:mycofactocin system GMC family oxidoreductase MftG, partial [Dietzia aurantiaca]|uniref:mycofactocin system GMC family oxidoreductase MftG n=1 Tax=Dietzia aurantiaca TaxID=983873 RepID=UPI0022A9EE09
FPGRVSAVAQARRGARRVTAFDAWDPPGAGVRVRTGARVARLSWADGAVGGRCDGVVLAAASDSAGGGDDDNAAGEVVATDLVVLCAGTIGSAVLLRNSGLGESTGHPVGERVQEHPEVLLDLPAGVAADVSFDHGVTAHRGTGPGDAALVPLLSHVIRLGLDEAPGPAGPEAPEIEVRPYAVPLHQLIPGVDPMPLRVGVALMNPLGYGRIAADGTVFLPDDPRDAASLSAAAAIVADRLGLGEAEPVPSTSQHLSGSARIGEVVDHTGRVMGVDGLYVADASVLPTLPRCGPYYTVLAVAEALATGLTAERPW